MRKIFVLALCFALTLPAFAFASEVPQVLSFQSLFFDDGGNPIADGDIGATFRILDSAGATLYEERQTLRVAGGFASALVGNGVTANGAPAGPMPASIFDADGPFYLEVQLDGQPPVPAMEIASVPFAMKSEIAQRVTDGAIESKAIADGGISFEDLSSKAVEEIAKAVTGGRDTGAIVFREDLETMYRAPTSAASIGVRPNFIYSGSNNLQDVLMDFDRSIKARDERVTSEKSSREQGDSNLGNAITNEAAARVALDSKIGDWDTATSDSPNLSGKVKKEVSDLYDKIGRWNTWEDVIINDDSDDSLSERIKEEIIDRGTAINTAIETEVANRDTAIAAAEARAGTVATNVANDEAASRTREIAALTPRLASAWGSVDAGVWPPVLTSGYNASMALFDDDNNPSTFDVCRVTFATPMGSANYAAVVTLRSNVRDQLSGSYPYDGFEVRNKTANGFDFTCRDVDFVVFGP